MASQPVVAYAIKPARVAFNSFCCPRLWSPLSNVTDNCRQSCGYVFVGIAARESFVERIAKLIRQPIPSFVEA
jgi:hypothetical protein